MLEALSSKGIMREPLFKVEEDLVGNYNRALETVIGKKTALTLFHIDKRGESPELEEELGKNYLQSGPSHRYCIIVSPDQKDAGLIHEEFSFDNEVLDFLYQNYLSGISVVTRVDALYGEINDDVRAYETLEDLLLIKKVHLELTTPSGFLTKARELQKYVRQLQMDPDLLIKNESAVPKKILELVSEVGDVRNYNLSPIQATKELTTFYTRLFGGVCIFRHFELKKAFKMKRPDQEPYLYNPSGDPLASPKYHLDTMLKPENQMNQEQTLSSQPEKTYLKTVVIYQQKDYQPENGPVVQFIPLQDKDKVIQFLVENGYADYSYHLIGSRLSRVEDETLLSKEHDVTEMGKEQRVQALYTYQEDMLPEWYDLKDIQRNVSKGHELTEIIQGYSATVKSMLLAAGQQDKDVTNVVEHILTRLYDFNYEKMYTHNRRHLERIYEKADESKRKYILYTLTGINKERTS
jgi:hypothetical protein